jgi:hypothetical protein
MAFGSWSLGHNLGLALRAKRALPSASGQSPQGKEVEPGAKGLSAGEKVFSPRQRVFSSAVGLSVSSLTTE